MLDALSFQISIPGNRITRRRTRFQIQSIVIPTIVKYVPLRREAATLRAVWSVVITVVHEAGQAWETGRGKRRKSPWVAFPVSGSWVFEVHECHLQHYSRLWRGFQLLGTPSLPSLQNWIPDMGIQVPTFVLGSSKMWVVFCFALFCWGSVLGRWV